MRHQGFGTRAVERLGIPVSWHDQSLPGFEELAMPLFDSLYNFASWLVRNQSDAEDLVQETYLKALRGFSSFQPGTNFRAWMFQILRNTLSNSRSKLERRMTVPVESEDDFVALPASADTPESLLIERHGADSVRCAIEQLPDIYRQVILLCDVEDASYREIAQILSIPLGTVMSRLARARKAVRELLSSIPAEPAHSHFAYRIDPPAKDVGVANVMRN